MEKKENNADKKFKGYEGYAVYSSDKKPLGVISSSGDRQAICTTQNIPSKLKKSLVSIEDQRFYKHGAIDFKGISRAIFENIKAGKIIQGGSTITQQLARNILKDNRKNIIRKIKEINLAFELEDRYSKDEILDLYFNNVFWGKKNYGLRTASLEYFSKEPQNLSTAEQIALLTFLRGPNFYLKNPTHFNNRFDFIYQTLYRRNILTTKNISRIKKSNIKIQNTALEIFKNSTVGYITDNINENKHLIISTLNNTLQRDVTKFVSLSKYPTSIICVYEGKVIAISSTNGSDYPFLFKSNVGSTLKPFIYSFLRENETDKNQLFKTNANASNWNIREAGKSDKEYLSLKDALITSNNNVFVEASYRIGIEKTLSFLSNVTNKPISNFVPASILGATVEGISLHELLLAYDKFFFSGEINSIKKECLSILNEIAKQKFEGEFQNTFLKTGTTNNNKERFAIVRHSNALFGFLRQGNEVDDYSKEGSFISNILSFLRMISNKTYKWD